MASLVQENKDKFITTANKANAIFFIILDLKICKRVAALDFPGFLIATPVRVRSTPLFLRSRNPNTAALNYSSNRPIANCIMDSRKNELSRKTMLAIHGLIHSWEQSKVKFEWLLQTNNRLVLDFLWTSINSGSHGALCLNFVYEKFVFLRKWTTVE